MTRVNGSGILATIILGSILAATGCAPSGDTKASANAAPGLSRHQLPIAAYQLTPQQVAEQEYITNRLEQMCMRKRGFTFLPGLSEKSIALGVRITGEFDSRLYGVSDPVAVRAFGYHMPTWVQGSAAPQTIAKLGAAEQTALVGTAKNRASGCLEQTEQQLQRAGIDAVTQQSDGTDPSALTGHVQLTTFQRAQTSPQVRAVFARWSACMRGYGYHYATPFTAAGDTRWTRSAAPSRAEIQAAQRDIGCKRRVNLTGVEFAVESRLQDQAIRANAAAFEQARKNTEREGQALQRLLASVAS